MNTCSCMSCNHKCILCSLLKVFICTERKERNGGEEVVWLRETNTAPVIIALVTTHKYPFFSIQYTLYTADGLKWPCKHSNIHTSSMSAQWSELYMYGLCCIRTFLTLNSSKGEWGQTPMYVHTYLHYVVIGSHSNAVSIRVELNVVNNSGSKFMRR